MQHSLLQYMVLYELLLSVAVDCMVLLDGSKFSVIQVTSLHKQLLICCNHSASACLILASMHNASMMILCIVLYLQSLCWGDHAAVDSCLSALLLLSKLELSY